MTEEKIIDAIEKALGKRYKSQGEFSRKTGISQVVMSNLLSRKHRPLLETVIKVAEVLGMEVYIRRKPNRGPSVKKMLREGKDLKKITQTLGVKSRSVHVATRHLRAEGEILPVETKEQFFERHRAEILKLRWEKKTLKEILETLQTNNNNASQWRLGKWIKVNQT